MEPFFAKLAERAKQINSLLCVGLDPHPADLPENTVEAALEFCLRLMRNTARFALAFKPNAAFFEQFGAPGWEALRQLISGIKEANPQAGNTIPVILDAKRGDIASTAEAYARSAFETLQADAITLSPYLGRDSIEPFLATPGKGVFLLCKTSNPGAADMQDLSVMSDQLTRPLYEHVALLAQAWNMGDNIGLVVGANQPEALQRVRKAAPDLWFLSPGVGAQGADLETALQHGLRTDGLGMLINISRSLAQADDPAAYAKDICRNISAFRKKDYPQ